MQEKKKKAMDKNIDPAEKALLLQLIEEDGTKLKSNLEKQKNLDQKFSYDPSKHVEDLLNKIKEAISNKGKSKSSNSKQTSSNTTDSSDKEDDSESETNESAKNT